jgi:SAM-dependent methyltransferase
VRVEELLVCPVCHAELDGLICSRCARGYASRNGILDFLPDPPPDEDVLERWPVWEQLERNGLVSYESDPEHNLSVGARQDCDAFFEFAQLEGLTLDIGCGPQRRPAYAHAFTGTFIGIDPLFGVLPREFEFVRGIGEYLPFRSDSFDRVLFATSLDHALSPRRALGEARRVTRPSGTVVLWFGEKRERAEPRESAEWYDRLSVPEGASDPFHAVRFERSLVQRHLDDAGLEVMEMRADEDGNVFMRARAR